MQVSEQQGVTSRRHSRWHALLAGPVLLLVIYIGFYWKLTLTRQYTWLESPDFANQVLPWFQFEAGEWHKGHFPAWDPFEWGGQSLIGQAQPGAAYPPNWILFLLPLKNGWIRQVFLHWYLVLIRYMGGLFCYLLCRDLKRSRAASLLAGTAFGITGWMGGTEWPQMINGAIWAPLVLMYMLRVARREREIRNGALAGAFLGVAFLGGHHQIPIYIALAAGGIWLYILFSRRGDHRPVVLAAGMFGVLLILVSALQMLPAYEYGKLSERWVGANEPVGWNTPVPYSVHTKYSLYPGTLVGMILPSIYGNGSPYMGMTLLALGLLAIAGGWRDPMVRILGVMALSGLLFALGAYDVFHGIVYSLVPMVEKARSASFAIFIFHFGMFVLAAYAADTYATIAEPWIRKVIWTVVAISGLTIFAMLALNMTMIQKAMDFDRLAGGAYYGLLLAVLLYAWRRGQVAPATGIALATMLIMVQSGLETGFAWPNKEKPSEYLKKMSQNADIVSFIRKQPRFVRLELDDQEIPYNFNDWQGIDTLNGYLASLTTNVGRVQGDYRARMLWGVNLWLGKKPIRDDQQELFAGTSGLKLYSNPEAFPATWVVHKAVRIPHDQVLETLQKYDLPQLRELTFVRDVAMPKLTECGTGDWSEVTQRTSDSIQMQAQLKCTGMVILGDTYYPGWTATVDGESAQVYEAYGMIRGVVVGPGRHRIELKYRPASVYLGAVMTALGLVGACLIGRFGRR